MHRRLQRLQRLRITRPCRTNQCRAIGQADAGRSRIERPARRLALQPPAAIFAGIGDVGRRPAERAGPATTARNDPAAGQHGRTDAGSDGEQDGIREPVRRTGLGLGEERQLRIVAEPDRDAGQRVGEVESVEIAQVRDPAAGRPLREAGYADAQVGRPVRDQQLPQLCEEILAGLRRRPLPDSGHPGRVRAVRDAGTQARAAQVDGEDSPHPFTPDATTESTKKRCRITNSSTGGSTARVAPAITSPVFMAPRL